jgi:hypothetical protein
MSCTLRYIPAAILLFWISASGLRGQVVEWLTPTEHHFGLVHYRDTVRTAFEFRNITQEPLSIDNVRPSCGCTVVHFPKTEIPPGQIDSISVEYDGRRKSRYKGLIKVYFSAQRRAERLLIEAEGIPRP